MIKTEFTALANTEICVKKIPHISKSAIFSEII